MERIELDDVPLGLQPIDIRRSSAGPAVTDKFAGLQCFGFYVVAKITKRGKPQDRIVCVTSEFVMLNEMSGTIRRVLRIRTLEKILVQEPGPAVVQFAFKSHPSAHEPTLVVQLHRSLDTRSVCSRPERKTDPLELLRIIQCIRRRRAPDDIPIIKLPPSVDILRKAEFGPFDKNLIPQYMTPKQKMSLWQSEPLLPPRPQEEPAAEEEPEPESNPDPIDNYPEGYHDSGGYDDLPAPDGEEPDPPFPESGGARAMPYVPPDPDDYYPPEVPREAAPAILLPQEIQQRLLQPRKRTRRRAPSAPDEGNEVMLHLFMHPQEGEAQPGQPGSPQPPQQQQQQQPPRPRRLSELPPSPRRPRAEWEEQPAPQTEQQRTGADPRDESSPLPARRPTPHASPLRIAAEASAAPPPPRVLPPPRLLPPPARLCATPPPLEHQLSSLPLPRSPTRRPCLTPPPPREPSPCHAAPPPQPQHLTDDGFEKFATEPGVPPHRQRAAVSPRRPARAAAAPLHAPAAEPAEGARPRRRRRTAGTPLRERAAERALRAALEGQRREAAELRARLMAAEAREAAARRRAHVHPGEPPAAPYASETLPGDGGAFSAGDALAEIIRQGQQEDERLRRAAAAAAAARGGPPREVVRRTDHLPPQQQPRPVAPPQLEQYGQPAGSSRQTSRAAEWVQSLPSDFGPPPPRHRDVAAGRGPPRGAGAAAPPGFWRSFVSEYEGHTAAAAR